MKRIIKGRMYDTDTARQVGETSSNGYGRSDFQYMEETLYVKRNGEYFLYGWGGAMTRYAEPCGQNCWGAGSKIQPLTLEQARAWAEKNLDPFDYMDEFDVEAEDMHELHASISMGVWKRLQNEALINGVKVGKLIEEYVLNAEPLEL